MRFNMSTIYGLEDLDAAQTMMTFDKYAKQPSQRKFVQITTTLAEYYKDQPKKIEMFMKLHRLIAMTEHGKTLEEANQMRPEGISVTYMVPSQTGAQRISVDTSGLLDEGGIDLVCHETLF